MQRIAAAALLLGLACSSPPERVEDLGPAPQNVLGFPSISHEDMVNAKGSFDPQHAEIFGEDLVRKEGVVPVRLEVGLRGEGAEDRAILLNPDQWELTLYLQDGTALRQIDAEALAERLGKRKSAQKVRDNKFETGFLHTEETVGFVFFELGSKLEFAVKGREVTHDQGDTRRGLDLYESLVAFRVTIEDEPRPFYVGIKPQ